MSAQVPIRFNFYSLGIYLFFNGPPVLVCTCLLFLSSGILFFSAGLQYPREYLSMEYVFQQYLITQTWSCVITKYQENVSRSTNMKNVHNLFIPFWRGYISWAYRAFDKYLWDNIGPDTLISISHYSY